MLLAGQYHTLTVARVTEHGLYLMDEEGEEVLLPNRYTSLDDRVGDRKEVFLYHDSSSRLVATTEHPVAVAGQAAWLEAVDCNEHGAFLEWGLENKHLFLPNRNMQGLAEPGRRYVVYLYRDPLTGRVVATTKLRAHLSNDPVTVRPGEEVDLLVAAPWEGGFRAVVNDRHFGVLYRDELYRPVAVGDRLRGWVRRIADDGRIDLMLQPPGLAGIEQGAAALLEGLRQAGGLLEVGDDSSPDAIARATGLSKKAFKRAAGMLLRRGEAEVGPTFIRIRKPEKP